MLAAGSRRQQTRASCKSEHEAVAQTNRRALLLALVAAPGLAQLQPAHAGVGSEQCLLPCTVPMPAEACVMHAEAPSLTTYKDKSDEFSLSVPASESFPP